MTNNQRTIQFGILLRTRHRLSNTPIVYRLRRHASLRSMTYFGGAALLLTLGNRLYNPDTNWSPYATAVTLAPLGYAWTYVFVRLRDDDTTAWNHLLRRQCVGQIGVGVALGTTSFLFVLGVAAAKKWVRLPAWGWEQTSASHVIRWLLLLAVGQLAVAWNEEVVMRGYGLHSVSLVVGKPAAAIGLTTLDAWAHGPGLRIFVGQGMVGLVLMILRLRTGALWMPIGYHFAWNYMQTAIFGPANTYPSLRPLHVTGPSSWLGQPGSPEPGVLSTLVHVGLAVVSVWTWWRRRSKQ